jgi:hypothetical protein
MAAMELAITIVFLVLLQAPPLVPQQPVDKNTRQDTTGQSKLGSPQAPQAPSAQKEANNEPKTANSNPQNGGAGKTENEKSVVSVVIEGHPDISVHKDRFDYAYIIGSILLTLITLVIAAIALKQANVAKSSVMALINSERAWVDGKIVKRTVLGATRYVIQIRNHGKTPAEIFTWSMKSGYLMEGTEFSPDVLSNASIQNLHVFLGSNRGHILHEFELEEALGESNGETSGAIFVRIGYADVVTDPTSKSRLRETSFVYYCRPILESVERISRENRYT